MHSFPTEGAVPGLIKGRREYGNGFRIERRFGPYQIKNVGHPRTPRKNGRPAPRSRRRLHSLVATIQFTWRDEFLCLFAAALSNDAPWKARATILRGWRGSPSERRRYSGRNSGPRGRRSNHYFTRSAVFPRRASCTHCAARKPSKASGMSRCQPSARPACIATFSTFGLISALVP